jgi:hypothetical protein
VHLLSRRGSANGWRPGWQKGSHAIGAARGSASSCVLEPLLEKTAFYHDGAAPASEAKVYILAFLLGLDRPVR